MKSTMTTRLKALAATVIGACVLLAGSAQADSNPIWTDFTKVYLVNSYFNGNVGATWVALEGVSLPELSTCNNGNRWGVSLDNPMFESFDRKLHEALVSQREVRLAIENRPAQCSGKIVAIKMRS